MTERLFSRADDFRQMLSNGVSISADIEADAKRLADKMSRIHGCDYQIAVDHDCGFIFINKKR